MEESLVEYRFSIFDSSVFSEILQDIVYLRKKIAKSEKIYKFSVDKPDSHDIIV